MELLSEPWLNLQTIEESEKEKEFLDERAGQECLLQLQCQLERICDDLGTYIVDRFHQFFNEDSEGKPRQWKEISTDEINGIYSRAKQKAMRKETIKKRSKLSKNVLAPFYFDVFFFGLFK